MRGRMVLESPKRDFGRIIRGARIEERFYFLNQGNGPLTVRGVHTDCGCTVVDVEGAQGVPPQGRGSIVIAFSSADFIGHIEKKITIITDENRTPKILTLSGDVIPEFIQDPPVIDLSENMTAQVKITPQNGFVLNIERLEYPKDLLEVQLLQNEGIWEIAIKKRNPRTNLFNHSIRFWTNSQNLPSSEILIRRINDFALTPKAYLDFGLVKPGKPIKRQFELSSKQAQVQYEIDVNILGLEDLDTHEIIKISKVTKGTLPSYQIELSHTPKLKGSFHGELRLIPIAQKREGMRIPIYGMFF